MAGSNNVVYKPNVPTGMTLDDAWKSRSVGKVSDIYIQELEVTGRGREGDPVGSYCGRIIFVEAENGKRLKTPAKVNVMVTGKKGPGYIATTVDIIPK